MEDEYIQCIRCGLCCITGTCNVGEEGDDYICKYLYYNERGLACCRLLEEGDVEPEDIGINGSGCVLQKLHDQYQYYMTTYGTLIERLKEMGDERKGHD